MKTSSKEVVTGFARFVGLAVVIGCEATALWLCFQFSANGVIGWVGSQVSFSFGQF